LLKFDLCPNFVTRHLVATNRQRCQSVSVNPIGWSVQLELGAITATKIEHERLSRCHFRLSIFLQQIGSWAFLSKHCANKCSKMTLQRH